DFLRRLLVTGDAPGETVHSPHRRIVEGRQRLLVAPGNLRHEPGEALLLRVQRCLRATVLDLAFDWLAPHRAAAGRHRRRGPVVNFHGRPCKKIGSNRVACFFYTHWEGVWMQ